MTTTTTTIEGIFMGIGFNNLSINYIREGADEIKIEREREREREIVQSKNRDDDDDFTKNFDLPFKVLSKKRSPSPPMDD